MKGVTRREGKREDQSEEARRKDEVIMARTKWRKDEKKEAMEQGRR